MNIRIRGSVTTLSIIAIVSVITIIAIAWIPINPWISIITLLTTRIRISGIRIFQRAIRKYRPKISSTLIMIWIISINCHLRKTVSRAIIIITIIACIATIIKIGIGIIPVAIPITIRIATDIMPHLSLSQHWKQLF